MPNVASFDNEPKPKKKKEKLLRTTQVEIELVRDGDVLMNLKEIREQKTVIRAKIMRSASCTNGDHAHTEGVGSWKLRVRYAKSPTPKDVSDFVTMAQDTGMVAIKGVSVSTGTLSFVNSHLKEQGVRHMAAHISTWLQTGNHKDRTHQCNIKLLQRDSSRRI